MAATDEACNDLAVADLRGTGDGLFSQAQFFAMIVCADDFGLRDDIDRAVVELCATSKLSAVSCMTGLARCSSTVLDPLLALQDHVDIGLHLCLTYEPLAGPDGAGHERTIYPPFGILLRRALLGKLDSTQIKREIAAQYESFLSRSGRRPDFIDGHLHTHQFPGIAEVLIEFVLGLPEGHRPYIRNTHMALGTLRRHRLPWQKSAFIGVFGKRLRQRLRRASLPTNHGFVGIYDFTQWQSYRDHFPAFVGCNEDPNCILVMHPGSKEQWRRHEFETLRAFTFAPGQPNRFQR